MKRGILENAVLLLRNILSDPDSSNIFFFLIINFGFAFVELSYGIISNSLGLISDSFHMFFDCTALVTGLVAQIISKWDKNKSFTYGFSRAEILAGFINSLLLVFIALCIFKEAVERLFDQPHIEHKRLFLVSVLGLLVNLVGVFVFNHGHSSHEHCHHGHNHSHHKKKHSDHERNISKNISMYQQNEMVSIQLDHSHGLNGVYGHNHQHHHEAHNKTKENKSQIIKGVFLHVLADTLGSVAVIISSLLISNYGWHSADSICSIFCSILILISVYHLLRDSLFVLMQRIPLELEDKLTNCLEQVKRFPGVYNIVESHFWTLCTNKYVGTISILVAPSVHPYLVIRKTKSVFSDIGVKNITVQIDEAR